MAIQLRKRLPAEVPNATGSERAILFIDETDGFLYEKNHLGVVTPVSSGLTTGDLQVALADYENTTELDVRSVADRDRTNHTGTQDINTVNGLQTALDGKAPINHTHTANEITDFEQAIKLVYDKSVYQDDTEQVEFTTSYIDRLSVDKTPLHTGKYLIEITYTWAYDSEYTNGELRLLLDGNEIRREVHEPSDSVGADGGINTDHRNTGTLKYIATLTANTPINVKFQFRSELTTSAIGIKDHCLIISRVLEV